MPDSFKNNNSFQEDGIKPYSFPSMSAKKVGASTKKAEKKVEFQRISYDGNKNFSRMYMPADEVPEDLEPDLKAVEEQAYIEGFERGEKEGLELGRVRVRELMGRLNSAILGIEDAQKKLILSTEHEAVELALAIAKKIICREVETDSSIILNVVKEALKKVVNHDKIKILLSPSDFQFMTEYNSENSENIEDFEGVVFEDDSSITNGGCIIDTNFGDIDARIEKQLQTIEDAFNAEIKKLGMGA